MHLDQPLQHADLNGYNRPSSSLAIPEMEERIVKMLNDWTAIGPFLSLEGFRYLVELWMTEQEDFLNAHSL